MKFYKMLKKLSQFSDHHSHKMSALAVRKGRIIGKGFNMLRTCPNSPHGYHFRHAEYNAYLNARGDIKGATIYIFRENKNGSMALARPCSSCYNFLVSQGVKKIIYTAENTFVEEKVA